MAKQRDPFVDHILDLLEPSGRTDARRMFGGYGLYREGLMFALIAGGVLYLKADDENRALFEGEGQERFSYTKQGKSQTISYYTVPESAMDDPEVLAEWADEGLAAARRAKRG